MEGLKESTTVWPISLKKNLYHSVGMPSVPGVLLFGIDFRTDRHSCRVIRPSQLSFWVLSILGHSVCGGNKSSLMLHLFYCFIFCSPFHSLFVTYLTIITINYKVTKTWKYIYKILTVKYWSLIINILYTSINNTDFNCDFRRKT